MKEYLVVIFFNSTSANSTQVDINQQLPNDIQIENDSFGAPNEAQGVVTVAQTEVVQIQQIFGVNDKGKVTVSCPRCGHMCKRTYGLRAHLRYCN